MVIKGTEFFPPKRELIPSYDFFDIASGTGYVQYDGVLAKLTGGDTYILMDSSLKAMGGIWGNIITGGNSGTPCTVRDGDVALDVDFDLSPFQLPRNIQGTALVKVSAAGDLSGTTSDFIITAKLRKVSGGEIEIASAVTASLNLDECTTWVLPITVPLTHFKKGDVLRLTIGITASGSTNQYVLFHDPTDQEVSATTLTETEIGIAGNTRLILAIPYRLDI